MVTATFTPLAVSARKRLNPISQACHNRTMKLKYETAVATLIQFVVLTLLNIATGITSVVSTWHSDRPNFVSNLLSSLVFFLLIALWFGFIWILGYAAQDRRSKHLARLLIAAEALIALVALFNIKHHNSGLGLVTSLIDLALALWVITLAYRLSRADGGRIMPKSRRRQRRPPITPKL